MNAISVTELTDQSVTGGMRVLMIASPGGSVNGGICQGHTHSRNYFVESPLSVHQVGEMYLSVHKRVWDRESPQLSSVVED